MRCSSGHSSPILVGVTASHLTTFSRTFSALENPGEKITEEEISTTGDELFENAIEDDDDISDWETSATESSRVSIDNNLFQRLKTLNQPSLQSLLTRGLQRPEADTTASFSQHPEADTIASSSSQCPERDILFHPEKISSTSKELRNDILRERTDNEVAAGSSYQVYISGFQGDDGLKGLTDLAP